MEQGISQKFEVVKTDPETGIVKRRVIRVPSKEYDQFTFEFFRNKGRGELDGHFVSNDTPLGERGRGKVFRYRRSASQYEHTVVNYEIQNGVARFIGFKGVIAEGYPITTCHTEEGDLLQVELKSPKIALTDAKEANKLRWVFRITQQFNSELLNEVEEAEDPDDEIQKDVNKEDKLNR